VSRDCCYEIFPQLANTHLVNKTKTLSRCYCCALWLGGYLFTMARSIWGWIVLDCPCCDRFARQGNCRSGHVNWDFRCPLSGDKTGIVLSRESVRDWP
jgi:hypothetical protein